MLARIFRTPRRTPDDIRFEVLSLHRAAQIEGLPGTRHMRRDVGLEYDPAGWRKP